MADAQRDITIERSLDQITQGIENIGAASKAIDKDLRAVQAGLKFDPTNTELLAQKQELLSQKLENSTARADELRAAIAELNRIKAENGQLTDGQSKLLATYEQQLKTTSAEVTGLTGATQRQTEANVTAAESTKTFSQSMTEFQSNLRAVNQVMHGLSSAFTLLGGDPNSSMGKALKQGQQVIQTMTGLASLGKLLQNQNILTAGSFSNLALAAGAAYGAFTLVDGLLGQLDGETRTIAGAITLLTAAVVAGAVAWMAYHGTMTLGVAVPIITAAVGAGIAGIMAMMPKTEEADLGTTSAAIPTVPSVPTTISDVSMVSGGTTTTYGEQTININIYDAGDKTAEQIMAEINTQWRDRKLAYR